jgi:tRNA1Val (adenine37-N6)-methyltransferase
MRKYKLEPKELRLVQPSVSKKPNILLIKGVRSGKPELKFHDPLIVYEENGDYTKEIYEIYGNAQIDVFGKKEAIHG